MTRITALFLLASGGAIAADACRRDSDCRRGNICVANQCVASREQSAAQDAGMALVYTKNTWPLSIVDRPLVVAPGMTEVQLGVNKDVSADIGGFIISHPLTADLSARYGVSDRIHAGLDVNSFCLSDCGPNFQFLSVGAGYAVVADHDANLVPSVTVGVFNVPGGALVTLNPGFLGAWRAARSLQIFASGGFILGVIGRDNTSNPDYFNFHLEPRIEIVPRFSIAPYIGYLLPLKNTDVYSIPVGVNLLVIADRAFDIGGSFEFSDIGAKLFPNATDYRSFRVFVTFRL